MTHHHPASQSLQWEQLQYEWEQQQQQQQLSSPYSYYPPQHAHYPPSPYHQPYPHDPYSSTTSPLHPIPPSDPFPPPTPLIIRIALTPTHTVDLPIDLSSYPPPNVDDIVQRFCNLHSITDPTRQQKLRAMVTSHLHHPPAPTPPPSTSSPIPHHWDPYHHPQPNYPPHPPPRSPHYPDPPYDDPPWIPSEADTPLQPTFAPVRPSSAQGSALSPHHHHHHSRSPSHPTARARPPPHLSPTPDPSTHPLPLTVSPHSLHLLRTRRPHYLQSPASQRLYQHAAVRAQQTTQRMHQHQAEVQEREAAELARCTFKPEVRGVWGAAPPARVGRAQHELIEDWDGSKRQRRIQRLQEEVQQAEDAGLSFHPALNAVSKELADDPLRRRRQPLHQRSTSTPTTCPPHAPDDPPQEKRERIRRFLQRTAERQRRRPPPQSPPLPSFAPSITPHAQALPRDREVVGAGERKRRRKCEEIFHAYQSSEGYIARVRWVSLVKALGRAVGGIVRERVGGGM